MNFILKKKLLKSINIYIYITEKYKFWMEKYSSNIEKY